MPSNLWTEIELLHAVEAYLQMLRCEKKQIPFVKTEINRQLQEKINRSKGSIEKRFQNISYVLNEHGLPYVSGYVPLKNIGFSNKEKIWMMVRKLKDD